MAEAAAVIGLVSAIVQFADFSTKVVTRLNDFQTSLKEGPEAFQDLKRQLPLLCDALKRTKADAEAGLIDLDTQRAVLGVVEGCQLQVKLLDDILVKILPAAGDSRLRLGFKAFSSVKQERKVRRIFARIQHYQLGLVQHQTTPLVRVLPVRAPTLFTVPFNKDPRFTGRHEQLQSIDELFKTHGRVALAGLGGVGKSQIAIEYCYRFQQKYPQRSVIWIHSSTATRIDQAYKELAKRARLPGWDDPKSNKLALVAEWLSLEETSEWLMVLDSADDSDVFFDPKYNPTYQEHEGKPIAHYIPQSANGRVLVTTRDRRVGERLANRVRAINVTSFTAPEAQDLLKSLVDNDSNQSEADARELLETVGHLPLAISQAAAFISENSMTVSEYLEVLRAGDATIMDFMSEELVDSRRDYETNNAVTRTWKMSFDHIRRSNPRAAEMLSLMSVLDRQGISKHLLRRQDEALIDYTTAVGTLAAFSMITNDKTGTNVEVHRLVHLVTQKWLELEGEIQLRREEALKIISRAYPPGIFDNWALCTSLGPHMETVIEYAFDSEACRSYAAVLLDNAFLYDMDQGKHRVALEKCLKAVQIREESLGKEHADTLTSRSNLAAAYWTTGQFEEAEELDKQLIESRTRLLGQDHPDTLVSRSNLAAAYLRQGRWKEAEELEAQVTEARTRVLGEDHSDTLTSAANLSISYFAQGRLTEAEKLQLQVMTSRIQLSGRNHLETLRAMSNLATTYTFQARLKEAAELESNVAEIATSVLGLKHPETLTSLSNLAVTYQRQGQDAKAVDLMKQVLALRRETLGPEHQSTDDAAWMLREWEASFAADGEAIHEPPAVKSPAQRT